MKPRSDRGVVLVLVVMLAFTLLVVAALVVDLSLVRQNRQADKSASDFAAAAGVRALDNGLGQIQPWQGICTALDFLLANDAEFAPMNLSYADGNGAPVAGNPCVTTPITTCTVDRATWGVLTGTADGGRIRVSIRNGYVLPDPAFAEDSDEYAGDTTGDPCEHLAVIVEEDEGATFGGVAGLSGYSSTTRSVARAQKGTIGDVTAALLLLERHDCVVLEISGTSGARVRVASNGPEPGVIHSDSLGDGADCDAGNVQNGNIFQVNGNPPDPRIVAAWAPTDGAPGQISTAALSDAAGANPNVVSSPMPVEVCVQEMAADCGTTAPITGGTIEGRAVVGRGKVDERYRLPIRALRNEAAARFGWTSAAELAAGWTAVGCTQAGPFTAPKIWVDCGGGAFNGNGKTFASSVDEVVINGRIVVDGNGNTLHFTDVETLFVRGASGSNGIELTGSNNRILVNDGALVDTAPFDGFVCDERQAAASAARTKLVVGAGQILGEGGSGKVLRMCSSTVLLMDDDGSCPIPAVNGVAPYDNTCTGGVRVAGNNALEWTAPNVNEVSSPTPAELDELEDLAFWSETQMSYSIEGGGGVRLSGIFFTPNADPFRVGGNGAYDIEDAQFITRKLEVAGNGTLLMRPLPQNSIRIPVLGGFTLVR